MMLMTTTSASGAAPSRRRALCCADVIRPARSVALRPSETSNAGTHTPHTFAAQNAHGRTRTRRPNRLFFKLASESADQKSVPGTSLAVLGTARPRIASRSAAYREFL
eukprot:6185509-Pleurochrysis_carterae.AAC.1